MPENPTTDRKLRSQTTVILQPLLLEICQKAFRARFGEQLREIVAEIL
jgi:hypothetical protein